MPEENEQDVEALSLYEDVIQEVLAGRTEGLACPICKEGELECEYDGTRVFLKCRDCGKFFEGYLA